MIQTNIKIIDVRQIFLSIFPLYLSMDCAQTRNQTFVERIDKKINGYN
jgi:hypothetical protein